MELILLVAAIIPVIILCNHVYQKDINKEPKKLLFKIFMFGVLSCIPIVIVELLLGEIFPVEKEGMNFVTAFINVFISIALVEEGFKWIVTKKCGYDNKEFDEVYDIIVYAVFASLGFACLENILYVLGNGLGNALLRAVTSIPGHACFGISMGYYLSKAKINSYNNSSKTKNTMLLSIVVPTLLHTAYDALLFIASDLSIILFFVFDITMVVYCFKLVNKMARVQSYMNNMNSNMYNNMSNNMYNNNYINQGSMKYCPMCGSNNNNFTYCPYCGYRIK